MEFVKYYFLVAIGINLIMIILMKISDKEPGSKN